MAESFIQVALDGAGKKVRNLLNTIGANDVYQQVVSLAKSDGTLIDDLSRSSVAQPMSAADGQDVNAGTTTDSAVITDANGTMSAKLRGIVKLLGGTITVAFAAAQHVIVDSGTTAVSNFPASQAVTSTDGAQTTIGTTTDASTTSTLVGLLKAIKAAVQGTLAVTGTFWQAVQPVSGTFWQATQPVSLATNTPDVTDRGARLLGHVTVDSAPAVTGTVTSNQGTANATPWNENISEIGGVAAPAPTAKGTQAATAIPVQELHDAGRTYLTFTVDAVTGITTEALATMTINKAGVVTTGTSYTVTAGKTLRLLFFGSSTKNTSTVATNSRSRVRSAATVAVTSGIVVANETGTPAAVANVTATDDTEISDGIEIAGGQQIGISHIESATTSTFSGCLIGYEY